MKDRLYQLGKQTLVYGLGGAALQLVGVITLPIFARTFTPSEFGALEIGLAGLGALLVIADLGMASASQRSYFDYDDEHVSERRAVLATAMVIAVATASVLAAGLIALRGPISDWLFDGRSYEGLLMVVALALPFSILATLLREVMRLRFLASRYTVSSAAGAAVAAVVGIALVLLTDIGVEGVVIGLVAGNVVAVIYGFAVVARFIGARLSRREARIMLAYGLPLVPAAAAMWGLVFLDRIMLSKLASLDDVGQYAVGARFASVLTIVVAAFGLAYVPFMLSLFAEDRDLERAVRGRTLTYVAIVLTGLALVLALFAREMTSLVAPEFAEAYKVVGVLCLGVTMFGLSSVTMSGIALVRQSGYFAVFSLAAVVVNVALNVALIPPLGGFGAALATALAYAVLTTLYYWKAQAVYPTPYKPGATILVVVAGAAFMPLGFLPLGAASVGLKVLGLLAFAAVLRITGVVGPAELAELRSLPRRALDVLPAKVGGDAG